MKSIEYELLVKTNSYAGNFERDMCAYLTGSVGDCGVGDEYIDESVYEKLGEDLTISKPDDRGWCRPVSVAWGDNNNYLVIYLNRKLTKDELDFIDKRAKEFQEIRRNEKHGDKKFKYLGLEQREVITVITRKKLKP